MPTDTEEQKQGDEKKTLGTQWEITESGACKRLLKGTVPVDKVREELERSYQELTDMVQIPGFRRGRVPRKLLEARFGQEVEKELKETLVNSSFFEVVEEEKLRLVGSPRFDGIEFQADDDLRYEAEFEVRPQFELGQYKGIEVEKEVVAVSDEELEEELSRLRRRMATLAAVESAEGGPEDYFRGSYKVYRDGVEVKAPEVVQFQPSTSVIDVFPVEDLSAQVEQWDRSAGAALRLRTKAPVQYTDEVLRGADVELEFELDEVLRPTLPALDEAFANEAGHGSVEELTAEIRKVLEGRKEREAERELESKIIENIEAATELELPETLVKDQGERSRLEREYELLQQGMSAEEVREKLASEGDEREEELRRELKRFFILTEIADKEKVFVTETDVSARVEQMAGLYGVPASALRERLKESGRLDTLRATLLQEKTRAYLRKKARVRGENTREDDGEKRGEMGESTGDSSQSPGSEDSGEAGSPEQ